jgi:fructokinase
MKYIAIEGGGTTWVAAVAEDKVDNIIRQKTFETNKDPQVTLGAIKQWMLQEYPFDAVGVASFGPIDGKVGSATYGFITSTPKPGWQNADVIGLLGLRDELKAVPFIFDTDVNAPAMAEYLMHVQPRGLSSAAYITVGTGVGVGLVINGRTVHGLLHPEAGHLMVKIKPGDSFAGSCPFHGDCIEGMTSSGALAARVGLRPEQLPELADDHPVWDDFAYYIAQLCMNLVLIASPERITLGGGLFQRLSLFPKVRSIFRRLLNGYIQHPSITSDSDLESFIGPSLWYD